MITPKLKDVSLCAIVRDEMMNPAQLPRKSGIRSFVESHVPYVEQAVIVDTGSVDGTREELEQLAAEFPTLRVYDRVFDDYASARNHSLSLVGTKRALVLDVDELVTLENFGRLGEDINSAENIGSVMKAISFPYFFMLNFREVNFNGAQFSGGGHPVRLFDKSAGKFLNEKDGYEEYLYQKDSSRRIGGYDPNVTRTSSVVLHFMPAQVSFQDDLDPLLLKYNEWYTHDSYSLPPSKRKHFKLWKKPNPFREEYK
jgi:glycosyltransferase involved in cell wall biosynthesis